MKSRVIILVSVIFFIFNLVFAEDPGPPKAKKWKGKGKPFIPMSESNNVKELKSIFFPFFKEALL